MTPWYGTLLFILILTLIVAGPTSADVTQVPKGGTVYLGEEDLNIRQTGVVSGSQIGYFGPGVSTSGTSPTYITVVEDAAAFYVSPVIFRDKIGAWYTLPGRDLAFYVVDPQIALRVYDETVDTEVTGRWAPWGDILSFRIESNLYDMGDRPGCAGAPVTIRIRGPGGEEFSSVTDAGGSTHSLTDIPVSTSSTSTGPIWYTGGYEQGNYTVWAECNANRMNDNYGEVGKTTTSAPSGGDLLVQGINPLITKGTKTTTTTAQVTKVMVTPSPPAPNTSPSPLATILSTSLPTPLPQVSSVATTSTGEGALETTRTQLPTTQSVAGFIWISGLVAIGAILIISGRKQS
jgi:hypothetical protein